MEQSKTIRIGAEVDPQTDAKFGKWAKSEKRSKRAHAAHLIERLTTLRDTNPAALAQLGLADLIGGQQQHVA